MQIKDKVVIITGGGSGLGKGTVGEFVKAGARVAIFDFNEAGGEAVAKSHGDAVKFFKVDVTKNESIQQGIAAVLAHFGAIHVCCNFAGTGNAIKTLSKKGAFPLEEFTRIIDLNLVGTFNVLRQVAEQMAKNDPLTEDGERGVIINTASVAAYDGQMGQAAYSASKGGVVSMTLPIARDLASYGIRVNTIVPGLIGSEAMMAAPQEVRDPLIAQVQFPKRLGYPAEIGQLACHIVENGYFNGECIRLDGAIRMSPR
jgi:NAD(P)-dependent dehydrogenase (short-subunit alcohol dehydrogenase family)